METVNEEAPKGRKTRGRQDRSKQEAVPQAKPVQDKIEYLVKLFHAQEVATSELSEAIKTVAEKSGLLASVVRKYVAAKAGDKFDEKSKEIEQLGFIFEV